jgi:hypothetical protein
MTQYNHSKIYNLHEYQFVKKEMIVMFSYTYQSLSEKLFVFTCWGICIHRYLFDKHACMLINSSLAPTD